MLHGRARRLALVLALAAISAAPGALGKNLGDADFWIRAGAHEGSPQCIRDICLQTAVDRTLAYQILFPAGADYRTALAQNQLDWNKAPGFTTMRIHWNSIRLGWRWLPNESKMELGFYGYLRGKRIERPLAKVDLGQWTDVEVRMHKGGLAVQVGSARYEEAQSLGFSALFPTPTAVLETVYFGGDETAPHDIPVRVRGLTTR
jgi:hypothetical protein